MTTCVALLRGVNVGGSNKLPMQDLREILAALGCADVRTYIQSGNAVFGHAADTRGLEEAISAAVDERFGFAPQVLVLTAERLAAIAAANPFAEAEATPRSLHVLFLAAPPDAPDLEALQALKAPSERFRLTGDVFYLHAPDGIGRSRLAAGVDRLLGVPGTGRNWRTITKLRELAADTPSSEGLQ